MKERHCRNCLRNCKSEEDYSNNLDANNNKIDWNCWFKGNSVETEGDYATICDGYILNEEEK